MKSKAFFALLVILLLSVPASRAQSITLTAADSTLGLVFSAIEKQSSRSFTLSEDHINLNMPVEFAPATYELEELLQKLAAACKIRFEQVDGTLVVLPARKTEADQLQKLTGKVIDRETRQPLEGAFIVEGKQQQVWTISAADGSFEMQLPTGRPVLVVSFVGYETRTIPLLLTTGHQPYLEVAMEASTFQIAEVEIRADFEKDKPVNPAIYTSGRSFSLDEAYRYAGTLGDPARMVRSYAGVVPERDDRNDIVIRGNSPTGLLWRLDGIEIPNPNHYGGIGLTGNTITLLNINLLDNSDFLTGAFPSSYGNATAGVFDLHLRRPNPNNYQFWFQTGWNGLEAGAEGPLSKKKNPASFMAVYRYSFVDAMSALGIDFGVNPKYQDFTTKVDIPVSDKLDLSFIGIASTSYIDLDDREQEEERTPATPYGFHSRVGSDLYLGGLNGMYRINRKSYLKSGVSVLRNNIRTHIDTFSLESGDSRQIFREGSGETKYSLFTDYTLRTSGRNMVRAGIRWDSYAIGYDEEGLLEDGSFGTYVNAEGWLNLLRVYAEDEYIFNERWRARLGVHGQYLFYNASFSLEPRAALRYALNRKQQISLSYGLHNQMQPRTVYFVETHTPGGPVLTNKNLGFTRSQHVVLGYDYSVSKDFRLKAEGYYQRLSGVPVKEDPNSDFSLINVGADFYIPNEDSLVNGGEGRNYGVELTLEKFLSKGYYFMLNGTVYQSQFRSHGTEWHNTVFNLGYMWNALAGYEYWFNTRFALGADLRATQAGGKPYTPVNEAASILEGEVVYDRDNVYSERLPAYFRMDLRIYYRINYRKFYSEFAVDFQNLTGRQNIYQREFIPETGRYNTFYHTGFFVMPTFKVQF